jgi:uncharacterized membrane protein
MKFGMSNLVVDEMYLTPEEKQDAAMNAHYAAVSYIPPLSLLMLISARKQSKFIRFHAKQAFVIMMFMIVGLIFPPAVTWVIEALCWALALIGFVYASMGRYIAIPVITHILSLNIVRESETIKKIKKARMEELQKRTDTVSKND